MKIIDAHLHFCPGREYFDGIAVAAGHENTEEHLREEYRRLGIVHGIVMGNRGLDCREHRYPKELRYCVGIDTEELEKGYLNREELDRIEENLRLDTCAGIKLYPGYTSVYVSDPIYDPVYELAASYKKPVAIHTGATAGSNALLKYSHPLTLDEAAVAHPDVQFVMCHIGNPFLMDAAAVLEKNGNMAADLSGLWEQWMDVETFCREKRGYVEALQTWIEYVNNYDKFMFGTDWPLVNLEDYIGFIKRLIPEKAWEKVFYGNAVRIYGEIPSRFTC